MQNKCLKESSVLEGLAETQQSQYKPDVSQQVLGGENVFAQGTRALRRDCLLQYRHSNN